MSSTLPILEWYQQNKRDLPWRNTKNPYFIWLSEVILQQTRVDQGLPYYLLFIKQYPTIKKLAAASDDDVMKLWQGLGYYNRAKNMLETARIIVKELNGTFPTTYVELLKLKGIGPYTAAAIASFAYNEPKAVVDGNVFRVLSRVFAVAEPINSTKGKQIFAELAQELLDKKHPAQYNQAIMELGATVCKPTTPNCIICVINAKCLAFDQQKMLEFPVKLKKQKPKERFLHFFFIEQNKKTYLYQRKKERIWHNLFEPPFVEVQTFIEGETIFEKNEVKMLLGKYFSVERSFSTKHQLTHQTIFAQFWIVQVPSIFTMDSSYISVEIASISMFAVHRLFDKFWEFYKLNPVRSTFMG